MIAPSCSKPDCVSAVPFHQLTICALLRDRRTRPPCRSRGRRRPRRHRPCAWCPAAARRLLPSTGRSPAWTSAGGRASCPCIPASRDRRTRPCRIRAAPSRCCRPAPPCPSRRAAHSTCRPSWRRVAFVCSRKLGMHLLQIRQLRLVDGRQIAVVDMRRDPGDRRRRQIPAAAAGRLQLVEAVLVGRVGRDVDLDAAFGGELVEQRLRCVVFPGEPVHFAR